MAKSSKSNSRHVVQRPDGKWAVKAAGKKRASDVVSTQREAVARAREIVRNAGGGEVRIHGRDGRIRESDTIQAGNDPHPPKDRR